MIFWSRDMQRTHVKFCLAFSGLLGLASLHACPLGVILFYLWFLVLWGREGGGVLGTLHCKEEARGSKCLTCAALHCPPGTWL